MTFDFGLLGGAAGCALGAVSIFRSAQRYRETQHSLGLIREESSLRENRRTDELDCLKKQFDVLQLSMQAATETLGDGKLTRSTRAQALQSLRSGVSPDTAASRHGLPKNDLRLLAKISTLISAYR